MFDNLLRVKVARSRDEKERKDNYKIKIDVKKIERQ